MARSRISGRNFPRGRRSKGFTLIELIAVVVIVMLLATFSFPAIRKVIAKADSQACASNLRQIGIAIQLAVQDNSGYYPNIEPDPTTPIYLPEEEARSLADVMEQYDVPANCLRCPADIKNQDYYKKKGISYEWRPLIDGEAAASPKMIFRRGIIVKVSPSRVRLATDFTAVHNGRQNAVFADGRVKAY